MGEGEGEVKSGYIVLAGFLIFFLLAGAGARCATLKIERPGVGTESRKVSDLKAEKWLTAPIMSR
jgi:hypothetical protein